MNADETSAYDFLKGYPGTYVSATEISRRLQGGRQKFLKDRVWARPILRRMEMDGILESNMMGEYRIKASANDPESFKKAVTRPGIHSATLPSFVWTKSLRNSERVRSPRWSVAEASMGSVQTVQSTPHKKHFGILSAGSHTGRMAWPADYHMHTPLCRHATGEPGELAAHALKIGLREIGFSDHSPMARDDFDNWRMRSAQLDEYVENVQQARRDYPDLTIKLALEVDYLPGHEEWIRQLAARHPWDYLIGSVHYVSDSWALDDPTQLSKWKDRDPFDVWSIYFDRLTRAAASGLFDIIGHADLPKKFGFRPEQDCTPLFERFLETARAKNLAVELNTAGLRKECREIYPSRPFAELMFAKNIPITFGSDAHAPGEVGLNFAEAVQLAQQIGYTHWRRFSQRTHTSAKLDT